MANVKDHLRRDAEHAVRMELALLLGQFSRRMIDRGYTLVSDRIDALQPGEELNGLSIGREAAREAFNRFLPVTEGEPREAITAQSDGDAQGS